MKYITHSKPSTRVVDRFSTLASSTHRCLKLAFTCSDRGPRVCAKCSHRGLHTAAGELDAGQLHADLATGEGPNQREVVAVSQVSDSEHAAFYLSKPRAERKVEAFIDEFSERIGIHTDRRNHPGQHRGIRLSVRALQRRPPACDRRTHAARPARVAAKHRLEPLLQQHVERFG